MFSAPPTQTPLAQVPFAPQVSPQLPQLRGSRFRSTHVFSQGDSPPSHSQPPDTQTRPAGQVVSQCPQFSRLVLRSTQLAPHGVVPSGQLAAHAPAEQNCPERLQSFPQVPQCCPFDWRSTQESLQSLSPGGQTHCPTEQTMDDGHAFPQSPQFVALVVRSTQTSEHGLAPAGHWSSSELLDESSQLQPEASMMTAQS